MSDEKFEQWCIVEIFGHQTFAGKVTEQCVGGCNFIRVDVPECDGRAAFTKIFGQAAIYCMTPVTEDTARAAVKGLRKAPVNAYQLALPSQPATNPLDDAPEHCPDDELGTEEEEESMFS